MTHGNDKAWLKRLSSHEFFILILTIKFHINQQSGDFVFDFYIVFPKSSYEKRKVYF